ARLFHLCDHQLQRSMQSAVHGTLHCCHSATPRTHMTPLPDPALDQIFRTARTHNAFSGQVDDATLRRLYDLLKLGPTEANSGPARFVFVRSQEAKAKLGPALSEGNRAKTMAAPVTVIVGHDLRFYDKLPVLLPHVDAKSW